MDMEKRFYVYLHLRKDGTPFYVGKGKDKRVIDKTSRSDWWWNIVNQDYPIEKFPKYVMLAEHLTEREALDIEVYWIALFGRRNIHENGLLVNNTDGGEGTVGVILSEITRSKMSKSRTGKRNPMWGTTRPDSVKLAVSLANKGRTNVWKGKIRDDQTRINMSLAHGSKPTTYIHVPTGLIVKDVINKTEFARQYGLNQGHISAVARKERPSHKGWTLYTETI
jgi:hypothetical protein